MWFQRVQGVKDSSEMLMNYKELNVWQKSCELCLKLYEVKGSFIKKSSSINHGADLTTKTPRPLKYLIKSLDID